MAAPTFAFSTLTYPTEFTVVSFIGNERMSRLFKYQIELKIPKSYDPDEEELIEETASFKFVYPDNEIEIKGILSSFEYLRTGAEYDYFRTTLVPEAWKESLGVDFEIFLQKNPKEIIEEEIIDAGLNADVTGINGATRRRDFTCQFNESNFSFISRIAEHSGIFYYFDHEQDSAMIFADDKQYPACQYPDLNFDPAAAGNQLYNRVCDFKKTVNQTASYVSVRDNNPAQPSSNISGDIGSETGSGNAINLVEEDVADSEEAAYIAQIRFEEIQSVRTVFEGQSGVAHLRPGYTFELSAHPRTQFNQGYLIVGIIHEGNNLDESLNERESNLPYYKNTFRAIKSDNQFRPRKITPKPVAISTKGSVFSEAGLPRVAERNEEGKYRVRFKNFRDENNIKSSYWLRMGLPAAGAEDTMDIPLKGGVEVQIGFENGNPDKPYIQHALANAEFPAHVTANNPRNALISTSGLLGLKANGGWHRKVHVDEEDWENKVFGNEDDEIYIMTNNGVNNVSMGEAMTEEDEYSGKYNVDRSYGDTYIWVDGVTYKWDNERAYSFGNDYEELHESGTLRGEVFDMGSQMRSIGDNLKGREGDDELGYGDWEDGGSGLIEKSWGDKCEYHEGRAFCWSGGRGPGGSLETFSYGNGYTENLLEYGQGTSADLPADKKEHADDYQGDANIDPSIATIEKSFGNTYSYQNGYTLDIRVGKSVSKTYGDSDSHTEGDSDEYLDGNSMSIVIGDSDTKVFGGTSDWTAGVTSDIYGGAKNEMMLALTSSISIGLANEVFLGVKMETDISAAFEIAAGPKMELASGGRFVVDATTEIKTVGGLVAEANATAIKNGSLSMTSMALSMIGGALHIIS